MSRRSQATFGFRRQAPLRKISVRQQLIQETPSSGVRNRYLLAKNTIHWAADLLRDTRHGALLTRLPSIHGSGNLRRGADEPDNHPQSKVIQASIGLP